MSWSMDQLPALDLSQHLLSGKDLQTICHKTCLSLKVLFGMALRQATGFVEILLRLVRLDWTVPDFSALSPRQTTLAVNIPSRGSKGPLHLLIYSTGIKVEGECEWHARKRGGPRRRIRPCRSDQWRDRAHCARSTSGSTRKHWRSALSRSPGAISVTPRCYPTCLARSRRTSRSAVSLPTAPMTPANTTTPFPTAALTQSSRPATMRSCGRPSPPEPWPKTRRCGHRNTLNAPSGDDGADITAGAASRRRCIV